MAAVNMTESSTTKHLVGYSILLILGNMPQLTYNVVDFIIAGRFIEKEALAAEDTASLVMNIVILGISGICMGASALMSEFYGAGQKEKLKRETSTTVILGCYFLVIIAILGEIFLKSLLGALRVSDEVLGKAASYLSIIFLRVPFTYFYNAASIVPKSVGDSKTPLKFLTFSFILDAVLDLIFTGGLGLGIVCSAVTIVVVEAASAVLCITYVYRKILMLQLRRGEFTMDRQLLRQTLHYGSVTALQQSCQPIGKLLIQGVVNSLGVNMIAVFNAINRIDDYAFIPEQSISCGITTFVAWNRGVGRKERIRKGFRRGLMLETCHWAFICTTIILFRRLLMGLFVTVGNEGITILGSSYLGLVALFYVFPASANGIQGFFRGMGDMSVTLLGTFVQTSLRVVFVYLLMPEIGFLGVAYTCAIGWSVMLLMEVPYYFWFMKDK